MTLTEFQKKVIRANWYDKYWFYLLYSAIIAAWLFVFYDALIHQAKYDKYRTRYFVIFIAIFLIFLGIRGLFLIPNRYKVLSIASLLPFENKEEKVIELIKMLGNPYFKTSDTFYKFNYKKNWWTSAYKVFVSFDTENFYLSVQSITGGYYGGGMVDFGGTEKVRRRISTFLTELLHEKKLLLT